MHARALLTFISYGTVLYCTLHSTQYTVQYGQPRIYNWQHGYLLNHSPA